MSEITINKYSKSITFINNDIAFSQFGVADEILDLINNLQNQLQQKENTIKEVRELINYYGITPEENDDTTCRSILKQFLEILDKGGKK